MRSRFIFGLLLALIGPRLAASTLLTNAVDLARILRSTEMHYRPFELSGQVISPRLGNGRDIVIRDATGCVSAIFANEQHRHLTPGDHIRAGGVISNWGGGYTTVLVTNATVLAHDQIPPPLAVTPDDIYSGKCNYAIVRLAGTIIDVFLDEANAHYAFIVLSVTGTPISIPSTSIPIARLNRLVGANVSIVGRCSSFRGFGPRAKLEYEVYVDDESDITVLKPAPADPFDVPTFEGNVYPIIRPKLGDSMRRKVSGRVEAIANKGTILLRTAAGELSAVELLPELAPPAPGDTIDAAGLAETDFFQLNLTRAVWRTSAEAIPIRPAEPVSTSIHNLYFDPNGNHRFDVELNGRLIRLEGTVFDLERKPDESGIIHLREGEDNLALDASAVAGALSELEIGCRLVVTGLCLAETENWRLRSPFPHIKGISVVLRSPDDLQVLSRPPWWTPAKLWRAILILLLAIVLLFVYSSVLTRNIRRRDEELACERRTRELADIKKIERTRLAIDLHDSLAQSINSCTMEVEAAQEIGEDNVPALFAQLEIARRSLQSCREELRNSIWDLRSDALEEPTLARSILRMLTPLVNKTRLAIKFEVPRERLSDHVCHAVIKIIRELTLNALHHGQAKLVKIAGKLEDGQLLFSVIDDGCGFDVENHPGVMAGHFGIQGVKERIKSLGGKFTLVSELGRGTKARAVIPLDTEIT